MVLLELNLKISQYIKDKDNILSYNSWSAGDYLKNTNGTVTTTCNVSVSNIWSDNADLSFYVTAQSTSGWNVIDLFRLNENTYETGSYTLELTVYNINRNLDVVFFNQNNISRVTASPSNTPIKISLSGEIYNDKYCSCRIITQNSIESYFDNIQLSKN